jgi:hypothetical protein
MLRRVALVGTDVSEELSAFFIRVTRIGELGRTLAATSNRLCLPVLTLLCVLFKRILIGIRNSMGILCYTPLHWIIGFLKSMNNLRTTSLYSHSFSTIWWMRQLWSVVDLLHRNPHWWSPIISSIYRLNLERKIFDKILYEVDSVDIPQEIWLNLIK